MPNEGENKSPELVEIDFFDQKIKVPADQKDQVVQLRQSIKDRESQQKTGFEERLKLLEQSMGDKQKEELDKKLAEFKKNNDVEGITKQLAEQHKVKMDELIKANQILQAKLRTFSIKDAIRAVEGVLPKYLDDAVILYLSEFDIIHEDGKVKIQRKDGTPILNSDGTIKSDVTEHAAQWIQNKPQYLKAKGSKGTGMDDETVLEDHTPTITHSQYNKIAEEGGDKARELAKKIAGGKIKIVQD